MSHFTEALYLRKQLQKLINENNLLHRKLHFLNEAAPSPPPPPPPNLQTMYGAEVALDAEAPGQMDLNRFRVDPQFQILYDRIRAMLGGSSNEWNAIIQWFNSNNLEYLRELLALLNASNEPNYRERVLDLISNYNEMWRLVQSMENMSPEQKLALFRQLLAGRQVSMANISSIVSPAQLQALLDLISDHIDYLNDLLRQLNELRNISLGTIFEESLLRNIDRLQKLINHWNIMNQTYIMELLDRYSNIRAISKTALRNLAQQEQAARQAAQDLLNNPNSTPEQRALAQRILDTLNSLANTYGTGLSSMSGPARMAYFVAAAGAIITLWEAINNSDFVNQAGSAANSFWNTFNGFFQSPMVNSLGAMANLWLWLHGGGDQTQGPDLPGYDYLDPDNWLQSPNP
jgi:hypothetical protein